MTIQQLIDELQTIDNKSLVVMRLREDDSQLVPVEIVGVIKEQEGLFCLLTDSDSSYERV